MLIQVEVLKTKKQNKKNILLKIFFVILMILAASYFIYKEKHKIYLFVRSLFLSEDIKFIQTKNQKIESELKRIHELNVEQLKQLNNQINDNINLLKYLENTSNNLNNIYYYLSLSYFYRILINLEFSKEHLIKEILRGDLPPIRKDKVQYEKDIKNLQIYTKKFLAIDKENNQDIQFIDIISDILNNKILTKAYYKKINIINLKSNDFLNLYYEWFYLVLNSNFGDIQKIESYFNNKPSWDFHPSEKLLIEANTYYYKKDYFNLIQTFQKYNTQIEKNKDKWIHLEFLRLLTETYFLQKNYLYAQYYINETEKILQEHPDEFVKERIKKIKEKIKVSY